MSAKAKHILGHIEELEEKVTKICEKLMNDKDMTWTESYPLIKKREQLQEEIKSLEEQLSI